MSNLRTWGRVAGEVGRWVLAFAGAVGLLVVLGDFENPDSLPTSSTDRVMLEATGARVWSMDFGTERWLAAVMLTGEVWMRDMVSGDKRILIDGPVSLARCVAFSPDARLLAVAGEHSKVRIWEVGNGQEREPLEHAENEARNLAFSADGSRLAVGGVHGYLAVWEVEKGRPLHTLVGHRAKINALAFSPDGRLLASGDSHGMLKLWNASEATPLVTLAGPFGNSGGINSGGINSIAFSPDGAWLAASDLIGGRVRLYDVRSGRLTHQLDACSQGVNVIRFSPRGGTLAIACVDGIARRWSLETHGWLPEFRGEAVSLHALDFRPDGRRLAAGTADGAVRSWEIAP